MMHENVFAGIFYDETIPAFVVKPLDLAARHDDSCFLGMLQMKTDSAGNQFARQLILETSHAETKTKIKNCFSAVNKNRT
jgi:hypothetical protein